ncbi:hypothetical protein M8J76_013820 [Diaphorina citri]|nr:hypothetical protein M8J76_013820 [Diaphorina citri]
MDGDRNDMDEDVMKSTSKGKKRKADDSLDLEGSFTEEEILDMSKAIMEVSTRIESVFQKVLDYPKIKSEIKLEMENLQSMNETLLKDTVMKKMEEKKTQLKKNLQMVTKKYCDRCAIVIENEEEEKRVIIAQLEKGPNLTDEEYATLIEKKWPEEAFTKTKVVTGDPFRTNSEHLIVLYEDIEEDSTLIKMVKDKYPEVKEVIQEEDEDDDGSLPFIENIVNTKKGTRKKRIYLSKVSATEEVFILVLEISGSTENSPSSKSWVFLFLQCTGNILCQKNVIIMKKHSVYSVYRTTQQQHETPLKVSAI